jgi:hypothetical protein
MRGITGFVVAALSLAACRQTVLIDQSGVDAAPTPDGGPAFCSGLPADVIIEAPEVIVALDRSSTMNSRFGDSTVLGTARDALDLYASRYQKVVDFGYVEFPAGSNLCSGTAGCCSSMPSAPNPNYAKFDMALHLCDQNSLPSCATASYQRPTSPALAACEVVFASRSDQSSRYVLLITNGTPDCGGSNGGGPNSACSDAQITVTDMARNYFVTTVVVAPGQIDPMASDCLGEIALSGGAPPNYPYYRPAPSPTDLTDTIGDVIREFARDACHVVVTTRIQDGDRAGVTWRDVQIPRDRNSGWELTGSFTLVLHGQWCDRLIEDGPDDFAVFPDCNPIRH